MTPGVLLLVLTLKATTVIPQNEYAEKVARRSAAATGVCTQTSYDEAAAVCKTKVDKIVQECRRVNQKYRDPHFDLEFDLKFGRRDCLESLWNTKNKEPSPSSFEPKAVKRVVDIFDSPQFYIDGPTANDVRQGRDGDCWLMAALCNLSNKSGLIEKVCVAHDQDVGVYGFVFHRDGEWFSEIIDDKVRKSTKECERFQCQRAMPTEGLLAPLLSTLADTARISCISQNPTTTKAILNVFSGRIENVSTQKRPIDGSTSQTAGLFTLLSARIQTKLGCHFSRKPMLKHTEIMPASKGVSPARLLRTLPAV